MDSPSVRLTSEQIDWESVEHSESFQELVHERRAFVLPRTAFFLIWYVAFIILAGYAPDFMAESVYQGLTVGYCLALTQFVMVWYLGLSYLKKADRVFEPLERAAAEHARSLPHRAGAPASETAPSTAGGDGSTGGVAVSYMYDNKPETARIVAGGDTITIFADQDGLPATFKRHEFMSANDRGQFSTGDFGQQKKGLL